MISNIIRALLALGFLIGIGMGFGLKAESAIHQIYIVLCYVLAAVCLAGAGIISAVKERG
jgi:hypothetical protein